MKALVLSGFLGAGKTSVLLQLARFLVDSHQGSKVPVAIIENEIGKVSVDSLTLGGLGLEYRELISGCVCCSISGEFESAVKEIKSDLDPDWLIVEATGLAYPDSLAESLKATVKDLDWVKILVLVDAARFLDLEKVSLLIPSQVTFADAIVLNKTDLVDARKKHDTTLRLRELNSKAALISSMASEEIPLTVLKELVHYE